LEKIPVEGYNEGEYFIPEVEFDYKGFLFKVVDDEKDDFNFQYPHYFGMIGYHDITPQISYVFFEDMSLDYITSMAQFMDSYVRFRSDE